MYYGREFCGRPLHYPYELHTTVQQIEHRTTRVRSPESNGMVERFNRTRKEECFSVAYRRRVYDSLDALPQDLDTLVAFSNTERAPDGYRTQGRTPRQTLLDHLAHPEVVPAVT